METQDFDAAAVALIAKYPGRARQARDNPELVPWFVTKIGRTLPMPPDAITRMMIRRSVEKALGVEGKP
jgi:hypothetical protein